MISKTFLKKLVKLVTSPFTSLAQREEGALREAQERRRLEEEVKEQRALIDALTVESLTLREESANLQVNYLAFSNIILILLASLSIHMQFLMVFVVASMQARLQQQISDLEQRLDAVVLVVGRPDSADSHTTEQITDNAAQSNYHKL